MMEIIIKDFNATNLLLEVSEKSIKKMLSNAYCFDVPNAKFQPLFKMGRWDGKIRLYDIKKSVLPIGLLHNLKHEFCKNFKVKLVDECGALDFYFNNKIEAKVIGKFVKKLELPFIPYDHQIKPILDAIRNKRMLIESPTSSGKSLIIYILSEWIKQTTDGKTLIIVPRLSLTKQLKADFKEYNAKTMPYVIHQGKEKEFFEERVCISTWQSIYNMPKSWYIKNNIEMILFDEVHLADGKAVSKIFNRSIDCYHKIGLTGTLKDSKTHKISLESKCGPIKKYITTKELMDKGLIAKMKINCLVVEHDKAKFTKTLSTGYTYPEEVDYIIKDQGRNDFISNMACSLNGNVLVMFERIKHGKYLFQKIKETSKKDIYFISGSTSADQREFVRCMAETSDCIIVASSGVFSTGISIKKLHYLIMCHSSKANTTVLQSIGRTLRKSPDGKKSIVIDIIDDLSVGADKNFTLNHSEERLKIYIQEKFEFDVKKIKL